MYAPVITVIAGRKAFSHAVCPSPMNACCIHCDTGTATPIRAAYLTLGTVRVSGTPLHTDAKLVTGGRRAVRVGSWCDSGRGGGPGDRGARSGCRGGCKN